MKSCPEQKRASLSLSLFFFFFFFFFFFAVVVEKPPRFALKVFSK
jgi:hypothetical protein